MPKGVTTKNDVLKLVLRGTDPAWRTNANGYIALHTGDPSAGTQTTNEVTVGEYTSYARTPITRDSDGWDIAADTAQNKAQVQCPQCTGGTGATITHVSYGELVTTGGQIYYCGILSDSLAVSNLIQPQFAIHALTIVEG
jgi:hypothetical protein